MFFTKEYQVHINDIHTISIRKGGEITYPYVKINDESFFGPAGGEAIEAIYECGFYSKEQYIEVHNYYQELMK